MLSRPLSPPLLKENPVTYVVEARQPDRFIDFRQLVALMEESTNFFVKSAPVMQTILIEVHMKVHLLYCNKQFEHAQLHSERKLLHKH